jgi:hypothetical protein
MFVSKKALSLWRRRRPPFLVVERALSAIAGFARHSDLEYAVANRKLMLKRIEAAKQRFVRRPGSY